MSTLSESCVEALRKMGEIVFPERIDWKDVSKHLGGYNKEKAIEQLIEAAKQDPLITKLKLMLLFTELQKLKNNGGLL